MADISFYLYLEAAFRHKLFKDRGAVGFKWERYNLPYESAGSSKGIFEYARKVLPSFYSLHYPDTKEGHLEMAADFIKKLDQRQDPQTARYFNPDTASREHLAVVEEAQTASQQANAQEASAASAAGAGRAPAGFPQAPAFVHNAAQARQPDTRLPVQPAEPTPDMKQAKFQIPKTPFPVKNTLRNLGSKAGVFFQRNIGKHLTVSRIATGVSATIGAVAGAGFGPLGALSGAGLGTLAPSWVKSGQATRFLGKAGNGAVNAWVSASKEISGGTARLTVSSGSKKLALGLVGGLFLFTLAGGIIGNLGGTTPAGQAAPANPNPGIAPIVKEGHACVTNATFVPFPGYANIQTGNYSYVCGHCTPIYNAIDAGINPSGGTQITAVTDGKVEDITNPIGGTALWLNGNDNRNYYYAHLQKGSLVTGDVRAGQVIGSIAAASDASSKNNGIAHVHFSAGTPGNRQDFGDPANIAAGPLLDTWCGNNVCNGKPNVAYTCTGGW